ncbi:cytochrome c oxidase accessory protein CcoG, partial [Pseudoalteromonas sp. S4488]
GCGYYLANSVLSFIFIWFDETLEGRANTRKTIFQRPMVFDKFLRKSAKHGSWWLLSIYTAITFVGYFTPISQLKPHLFTLDETAYSYICLAVFAVCNYGNAGWMREIMCLHICRYSRFQSAIFYIDQ